MLKCPQKNYSDYLTLRLTGKIILSKKLTVGLKIIIRFRVRSSHFQKFHSFPSSITLSRNYSQKLNPKKLIWAKLKRKILWCVKTIKQLLYIGPDGPPVGEIFLQQYFSSFFIHGTLFLVEIHHVMSPLIKSAVIRPKIKTLLLFGPKGHSHQR